MKLMKIWYGGLTHRISPCCGWVGICISHMTSFTAFMYIIYQMVCNRDKAFLLELINHTAGQYDGILTRESVVNQDINACFWTAK